MPPARFLALGATALLLAGCNEPQIKQCPGAAILTDTSTVTNFRPGAPEDLSGEAYTARVGQVQTDCTFDRTNGVTVSSLSMSFRATRAPTADAANYSVPYYVAVTQGDRIISKQVFNLQLSFAPGAVSTSQDDSIDTTLIQLENGHPPTDYQLTVGFQLTAAQRAYNEKMGRYIP